jgi:mono/diheme cytochrome c family protein
MKRRIGPLLVFLIPAVAGAQGPRQDLVKRGAEIFTTTCTGYCHAAAGAGGGAAPRLAGRGFDEAYLNATISNGIPGTPMPAFNATLGRADVTAVVAYIANLNGITSGGATAPVAPSPTPLSPDADRGRQLFSDALRSFGRCSTCHEINGIGISVATPIASVPADVAAFRRVPTARVVTARAESETMPALVISDASRSTIYYDLTSPPPVLRTAAPGSVKFTDGSSWQHASVIRSYTDRELELVLTYLRVVLTN